MLDGQVRLHSFGLDVTGFRWDLSHRYQHPLLRITTFVKEPERHDLYLNVGLYTEALHFEVAPRGIEGEQSLTLANVQATLDLWQSEDLRSYVRLRVGPGVEMRLGPWGEETRYVGIFPQAMLEGNLILGHRAMQRFNFRCAAISAFRHLALAAAARRLDGDRRPGVRGDPHRDQRSAGVAALAARPTCATTRRRIVAGVPTTRVWAWTGTAGIRMSFFSPPVPPAFRK